MKLPNGAQAIIDRRKIAEYSLSPTHEDGQHKARLFASLVGLTVDDADELIEALRAAAEAGQATIGKIDKYGERYLIDFEFRGRIRSARIAQFGWCARMKLCLGW